MFAYAMFLERTKQYPLAEEYYIKVRTFLSHDKRDGHRSNTLSRSVTMVGCGG